MKSSILIALAAGLAHPASAAVISLNMASLPSAQGWTYQATGATHAGEIESSIWSTNGTTLTMNTMPSALVSPSSNLYVQYDVVTPIDPIVVSWRSRVLESEFVASSHYGWSVLFATGSQSVMVGFETNLIRLGQATDIGFTTTGFHDYRIEFIPGDPTFSFFVDNAFLANGNATATTANYTAFGDGSGASNARAEMTNYTFSQVPEPSAVAILFVGALAVMARRQRK